jgi:hypothetical protein
VYRAGEDAVVELVVALTARVDDLERRLAQNSSNSSRPPSSDPPQTPKRGGRKSEVGAPRVESKSGLRG